MSNLKEYVNLKMASNTRKKKKPSTFLHLVAGGVGGTAGVCATCPLDVVQTRLQSSVIKVGSATSGPSLATLAQGSNVNMNVTNYFKGGILSYMKFIIKTEGILGLYKGLLPNIVGVAPARAIYFSVYSNAKAWYGNGLFSQSSPVVHMMSALTASFATSTVTNPIWFIKTRLQLDFRATGKRTPVLTVIRTVYKNEGIKGFYRGVTASYAGASETMIYFVIYEKAKEILAQRSNNDNLGALDYIVAAAASKMCASFSVYPHEVARTRLRQQAYEPGVDMKYNGFFQTLLKVYREEGRVGLYGGLSAHLLRQVPNTVIMFLTYEGILNVFG